MHTQKPVACEGLKIALALLAVTALPLVWVWVMVDGLFTILRSLCCC